MAEIDSQTQQDIYRLIATELGATGRQVQAAVQLLDEGATVPFVARYRKEATGGLDDTQLRTLHERLGYLRELEQRRQAITASIGEQGRLTPALAQAIAQAATKQELEDLYLPYKPKRRTKGQIAREAGLEPLAEALFADPQLSPRDAAQPYVQAEGEGAVFTTVQAVLDGARDILAERWAEDPALVQSMRQWLWDTGLLVSRLADGQNPQEPQNARFKDYFDYCEAISRVPSHRALAVFRGRTMGILQVRLSQESEPEAGQPGLAEGRIAMQLGWSHQGRPGDDWLRKAVAWTWRVKLSLSLERDLFGRLREAAEAVAIRVFGDNLRDLLLAAPAGAHTVMGLDPGIRTGVKVAVVDATGKLLETATVFPHEPRRDWQGALHTLAGLCTRHGVVLIAIGNGTASRETDRLAAELIALVSRQGAGAPALQKIVVSEAGASVYSASAFAAEEMPDIDVSLRGAVSIARRLQDPLAELVKIDPKSIGVGQYQHDVNQSELARTLDAVVEDCVNGVGVDLNTASVPLLSRVSGLSLSVAKAVVRWRESNGIFRNRQQLLKVSGLGPKAFEQSAGFLRLRDGENPLDRTGVHPETYPVVEAILQRTGRTVGEIMGNSGFLKTLRPEQFASEAFGAITVRDILGELEKPGRDPRPDFVVARLTEGVEAIADLRPGMVLEGTVSNVAQFGAFVDLGVHQDGLIHVSQLAERFVSDAREIVKTGQVVKVTVLEVDSARKRISLSMRKAAVPPGRGETAEQQGHGGRGHPAAPGRERRQAGAPAPASAMQSAFARLQGLKK